METLVIQVTNQKALELLHGLEELHWIKVLKENVQPKQKLSEKYGGKLHLTDKEYNDFQAHISRSRDERDSNS